MERTTAEKTGLTIDEIEVEQVKYRAKKCIEGIESKSNADADANADANACAHPGPALKRFCTEVRNSLSDLERTTIDSLAGGHEVKNLEIRLKRRKEEVERVSSQLDESNVSIQALRDEIQELKHASSQKEESTDFMKLKVRVDSQSCVTFMYVLLESGFHNVEYRASIIIRKKTSLLIHASSNLDQLPVDQGYAERE